MNSRFNYAQVSPGVLKAMLGLERYLASGSIEKPLKELIALRASQMNNCAYCIDMHTAELRKLGETNERLALLSAWREVPYGYTPREQAALAWAEAGTILAPQFIPDEVFAAAHAAFTEIELADLTLAVAAINAWNRLGVAFRLVPESLRSL
jgi:AhpD family alkylhydroperoxidase